MTTTGKLTPSVLKAEIEARCGSLYQFAKRFGLDRAMVYRALDDARAVDQDRLGWLQAVLRGSTLSPREWRLFQAIKEEACKRCVRKNWRSCARCDDLYQAQARAAARVK